MSQSGSLNNKGGGGGSTPLTEFTGEAGTTGFPVMPSALGDIQLSSTGGTILITGTTNTINFDVNAGAGTVTSVMGTNGVTAVPTTGAVVVSGVNATTSSVGVASFNPTYFTVNGAGQVTPIDTGTVTSVTGTLPIVVTPSSPNPNVSINLATTSSVGAASFNPADFTVNGAGQVSSISSPTTIVETLTGNSGGAISPDIHNNINTLGSGSIIITGAGNTLTTMLQNLTNHAVLVGAGTSTITNVGPGTTNTVLLGNTGSDPSFGLVPNAALANSSITLANGNNISISGSPVSLGGTATINVSGTSQYTVQVGNSTGSLSSITNGTTGQVFQANTLANPTWSTATYPSTTTVNQLLYSSSSNVVAGLATADSATLVTTSAGVPVFSSTMTNGQVIIGSTGATPTAATITAGTGISVTNGAGSITIANTSPATFAPNADIELFDDFVEPNTLFSTAFFTATTTTAANPGIMGDTGGGVSYAAGIVFDPSGAYTYLPFILGGGVLQLNFVVNYPILSNGTNTYTSYVGLTDGQPVVGAAAPSNGCYFSYSSGLNSGNWQIICNSAGTATTTNLAVGPTGSFENLGVLINAEASLVTFTIAGISVGTISTNIPTTALTPMAGLRRTAGTIAANSMLVDLIYINYALTTAR